MSAHHSSFARYAIAACLAGGSLGALGMALWTTPARAQFTVFDPTNYSQNLLTAARALQQVNNQIQSLQNQATMILNQAKNLSRIDFPELQQLNQALQQIDRLMGQAQSISFRAEMTDSQFKQLYPNNGQALSGSAQVAAARARLDASLAAYRQTMGVQARVVTNVQADEVALNAIVAKSQGAEGALQVGQATNQLLALVAKQQLQLQTLLAAQYRADATDAARRAQSQSDARAAATRFLGSGTAYTPH